MYGVVSKKQASSCVTDRKHHNIITFRSTLSKRRLLNSEEILGLISNDNKYPYTVTHHLPAIPRDTVALGHTARVHGQQTFVARLVGSHQPVAAHEVQTQFKVQQNG